MSSASDRPAAGPAAATDQSMEDILASIRRILNEDETPAAAEAGAADGPEAPPADPPADEPFLLTEEMMVSAPGAAQPAAASAPPRPEAPAAHPAPEALLAPAPEALLTPASEALLAPAAAAAAAASVGQLLRAVSAERGSAVTRGGPTIEEVVREELRPLLKDWLDQHLPPLVERLVRAEIERVVGRALS